MIREVDPEEVHEPVQVVQKIEWDNVKSIVIAQVQNVMKTFAYEHNDAATQANAKRLVSLVLQPYVDVLTIYSFKVVCDDRTNDKETVEDNSFHLQLGIKPVMQREFIVYDFVLSACGNESGGAWMIASAEGDLAEKDFVNESSLPKKIFISGPMTGLPDFNFPRFNLVAKQLEDASIDCINPVDVCKKYNKETVLSDPVKFQEMIDEQQRLERECDAILLLDGWHESKGVRLELKTALELDMKIYLEEDLNIVGGRLCGQV